MAPSGNQSVGELGTYWHGENVEIRTRVLRWLRKYLLHQIRDYWKWMARFYKLDEQEFYNEGRWTGILNVLGEDGPLVKKTFREVLYWYLYGMDYVRAYVRGRVNQRKFKNPFEFVDRQKDDKNP